MAMNNSLAEVRPELVSEWSEKNLPLTPDNITFGSNKKVCIVDSSGDITTDVPMEHVVNHLRKKNRNFRRNVSDVHIIKGMVIVFLVCES